MLFSHHFQTSNEVRARFLVGEEDTSGFSDLNKCVLRFTSLGYLVK